MVLKDLTLLIILPGLVISLSSREGSVWKSSRGDQSNVLNSTNSTQSNVLNSTNSTPFSSTCHPPMYHETTCHCASSNFTCHISGVITQIKVCTLGVCSNGGVCCCSSVSWKSTCDDQAASITKTPKTTTSTTSTSTTSTTPTSTTTRATGRPTTTTTTQTSTTTNKNTSAILSVQKSTRQKCKTPKDKDNNVGNCRCLPSHICDRRQAKSRPYTWIQCDASKTECDETDRDLKCCCRPGQWFDSCIVGK